MRSAIVAGLVLASLALFAHAQLFAPIGLKTYEASFGNSGPPRPFFSQTPAINYDIGGQGVGYNVPIPFCVGTGCSAASAAYRADAVNFKTSLFGTGFPFQIGFSASPNGFSYTINISQAGPYQIVLWASDTSANGSWNVFIDNTLVTNVPVLNTGSYDVFNPNTSGTFNAGLGTHIMRLAWGSGDSVGGAGDLVAWQGTKASTPTISAVGMSCGNSCTFTANSAGTVGTAQATMSSGAFTGTWSLQTSGTDHVGTACANRTADFTINSSTGIVSNNAVASGSYTGVCLVATQFGANGSPFVQAVTITGSSGLVCDIGPTFTGTIPHGAQAAGMTHCAANLDFTSNVNFTYNGHTYNMHDPSTWMDVCGAASPLFFSGVIGGPSTLPCSRYAIGNDGGLSVLDLNFQVSDFHAGSVAGTVMQSKPNGTATSPEIAPGMNHYHDVTFRIANGAQNNVGTTNWPEFAMWTFGDNVNPNFNSQTEFDTIEYWVTTAGSDANVIPWDGGTGTWQWRGLIGVNNSYHSYGHLLTSNGSNSGGSCAYIDDVGTPEPGPDNFNCLALNGNPILHNFMILSTGESTAGSNGSDSPPTGPIDMLIKSVTIWTPASCGSNWPSSQCTGGPIFTGTPP